MSSSHPLPILLVVGPHRSGTSLLTQALSTLGFDLGRSLMPPSFDNPRGFWENEKIVERHDALLSALGRDWTTAAGLTDGWAETDAAQNAVSDLCKILQDDFNAKDPSLIKDPRLCHLSPLWSEVGERLERPVYRVMITREPDHIAASIARRDGLTQDEALAIALSDLKATADLDWPDGARAMSYEAMMGWASPDDVRTGLNVLEEASNYQFGAISDNQSNQILALVRPLERASPDSPVAKAYHAMPSGVLTPLIKDVGSFATEVLSDGSFEAAISAIESGTSLKPPQSKSVTIARGEFDDLKARLDRAVEERDAFKDGVADREKMLGALRRKLNKAVKDRDAFKDGVADREQMLSTLRSDLKAAVTARDAFRDGITEREATISDLRAKIEDALRENASLLSGIKDRDEWITSLQSDVASLGSTIESQQEQMERDALRAQMVEEELTYKADRLQERVTYFEGAPLKRGLKLSVFGMLRRLRQRLPIAEETKLAIARKLTPLALRLKPHRDDQPTPFKPDTQAIVPAGPAPAKIDFAFKETDAPIISIIVPVYNEIDQTVACLRSIYQQRISVDYEVILADDKSPDPRHTIFNDIPGLRYFRNETNLHFLRNCNQNATHARGDYLVFLNNDTLVKPGWLQSLYDSFAEHGDVGIVGSKLIFPDGSLQEAGGIIWEDASGWNWGRGQNPRDPLYNFVRDADYVSGASFMIPTAIWKEMGGFSETLEKAYYEDTDLCFRLREAGYRVLYQPASEVIHIEGLSSGTDLETGVKQYQIINQQTFKDRWADTLAHHWPNATTPLFASDRSRMGHVLYIDAVTPEPDADSGSLDAINAMRILQELGYRVHFVPGSNFAHWGKGTKRLQQMGIECLYHPFFNSLDAIIEERGDMFDYVVLSRPESAETYLTTVETRLPRAKIIYNTVDLHFMRMQRRAVEQNQPDIGMEAESIKKKELDFIGRSDATIVLSGVEKTLLSTLINQPEKLWTIPLIREKSRRLVEFETTRNIAFIGGYRHPPNVDAVEWLMNDIWPEVEDAIPDVKLLLCGSNMPDAFKAFESDRVEVRGFVPDLNALLSTLRLTIAPLRFGAGLKGKVASSIGAGVPCIGTDIAFEGMAGEGLEKVKFTATTPQDFVTQIKSIYDDEPRWTAASKAGVAYHNRHYAYTEVMKTYRDMLGAIQS